MSTDMSAPVEIISTGMSLRRKNTADGVITFHASFPLDSLKSRELKRNLRDWASYASVSRKTSSRRSVKMRSTSGGATAGNKDEACASGPRQGPQIHRLSHPPLRQLQAKLEAEKEQTRVIIQPLLDTENDFVKELECFLEQCDTAELRKRELLHKRWTQHVWIPFEKRLQERMSSRWREQAERRRITYSHYIKHCSKKGFVFLENYDPQEYNPFLINIKKPHYLKHNTSASHEGLKEKRGAHSCNYTGRQTKELREDDLPHLSHLSRSVAPQTDLGLLSLLAVSPLSASSEPPVKVQTKQKKSNRFSTIPFHIISTATTDGRCYRSGCWSSRR
ncbi:protein FAM228A isoform X2 [Myripristis murdjan]|uniref:protein FAM228A isoform X2 n=1 Tax=Myripristis murdjan TaxID=586833 RepID=UPI001175E8BA|nr:protein FAM228B isoform X2 [Myripristis murdjan]